jgi:hypothetical protein
LKNFGENNIKPGMPMATLEEALVPVYFFHRYQIDAASKVIGGLNYRYALRGDGQPVTELLTPQQELNALEALLKTVQPSALMIPENIVKLIPPRPLGYQRHRELVKSRTDLTFDPLGTAETAADLTFSMVLLPARANRVFEHHSRDARLPALESIIDRLLSTSVKANPKNGYEGAVQMSIDNAMFSNLAKLAVSKDSSSPVKAIAMLKLQQLKVWLISRTASTDEEWKAFYAYLAAQIGTLETAPEDFKQDALLPAPPGMPIGDADFFSCER